MSDSDPSGHLNKEIILKVFEYARHTDEEEATRLGMTKVSLLLDVFDRNCPHRL